MAEYKKISELDSALFNDVANSATSFLPIVIEDNGTLTTVSTSLTDVKRYIQYGNLQISGTITSNSTAYFKGDVYVDGTLFGTTDGGTSTVVSSGNFVDIQTDANLTMQPSDNGRDIGIRAFYYKDSADVAALVWKNTNSRLTWFGSNVGNSTTAINPAAVLGTMELGQLFVSNTTSTTGAATGALQVAGGTSVGGNLRVNGTTVLVGKVTSGEINTTGNITSTTYVTSNFLQVNNAGTFGSTITVTGAATVNSLVSNGSVTGTSFIGNLTGNANTATKLATARTISLTGDVTGSVTFDGSANASIATIVTSTSLPPGSVVLGTSTSGNYVESVTAGNYVLVTGTAGEGWSPNIAVDATSASTASKVVARDANGSFSANIITSTSLSAGSLSHTGTTGSGDIGSDSNRFGNIYGIAVSALYADLAEKYIADADYSVGTVVVFGGLSEITVSDKMADTRVAGVISEKPAYIMNGASDGQPVALRGKVPVKIVGAIEKGDLLVTSTIPGFATSAVYAGTYDPNAVFAKSLESSNEQGQRMIMAVIL